MIIVNTKTLARKYKRTTAEINEMAREYGIEMEYRADLCHWEITNRAQSVQFMDYLAEF